MNWASLCVRGYHCAVTTCDIVYIKIYFLHKSYRTIFKNILRFLSEPFCLKNKNLRTTKNCHFKTLPFIGLFSVDSSIQIRIKPFVEAVRAKLYVQPLPTYGLIMFFIYLRLLVSLSRLYSINPSLLHFSVYHFQINTGSYFLSPPSASSCRPWQPISEAQNATPTPLQKETSSKQYFYNIFVEKYFPIKGTLSVAQLVSGRFPLYQRSEVGNANPTVCHH